VTHPNSGEGQEKRIFPGAMNYLPVQNLQNTPDAVYFDKVLNIVGSSVF